MTEAEILASIVKRIEAVRDEKKLLAGSERDLFAEAKGKHIDGKALRRVLQRRAMDDADREAFDDLVDQYEQALAGKAVAAAALKAGATVREAAKKGGISVGAAHVQKTKISEHHKSEAAASSLKDGERAVASRGVTPPAPVVSDTPSPAGGLPLPAGLPQAAPSLSPDGVPAGEPDPDPDWERRDGAATYDGVRQIQREALVASGAARLHPAEIDITLPDRLRRA